MVEAYKIETITIMIIKKKLRTLIDLISDDDIPNF